MRIPLVSWLSLSIAAALLASGCAVPAQRTAPPPPAWLTCDDHAERISADTTVAGGTDHLIRLGHHSLAVPAEAIEAGDRVRFELSQVQSRQVRVTVETSSSQPFPADLTLTLSYEGRVNCMVGEVPASQHSGMGVYRIEGDAFLPPAPAPAPDKAVTGMTRSFSTFAIAS